MYILSTIVFALILIYFRYDYSKVRDFSLDFVCTEQIKGLAILMVILGHLNTEFYDWRFMQPFGSMGVALFLFISGYGLTKSFENKRLDGFFKKRITAVLIPYSVVTVLWIIVDYLSGIKHSTATILLAVLGLDFSRSVDETMWYISFIIIWYVAFYLTFRFVKRDLLKIAALFSFSLMSIIIGLTDFVGGASYLWEGHSIIFPIGVFYAMYAEKYVVKYKNRLLIPLIITSSIIFYLNFNADLSSAVDYIINDVFFILTITGMLIVLRHYNLKSLFLEKIGSYSYELYLFEGYLISKIIKPDFMENGESLWIYLLLVIVLSYSYHKVIKITNKKIYRLL